MLISRLTMIAALGLAISASAFAQQPIIPVTAPALSAQASNTSIPIVSQRVISFSQLGYTGSIKILGSENSIYVGFGSRLDEVVSKATLHFDLTPSPALLALVSHIKVYFNNELMGVVSISDGQQGKKNSVSMPLDTRFFSNFNQLRFELIGNTNTSCANPNDSSIWAEIGLSSHIDLQVQKTLLKSELSLLPAPFFDERDFNKLKLPVVMGSDYDLDEIKAAGIAASYFGTLSEWRSTSFPLSFDKMPDENAIVFITNNNKPEFLKDFPDADGPYLQVISHPRDPYVKLLLVIGRDSEDLNTAIKGLALGTSLLTGPIAKINSVNQIVPRQAYDAPNWISTTRPTSLSELVKQKSALQVEGRTPPPIRVDLRLPPDLFTWQSRGIPMDLNYHYSPPTKNDSGSRLSLSINNQFIEAFNLTTDGQSGESSQLRIPLIDDNFLSSSDNIPIPAFKVGSNNHIKFEFSFASVTEGMCQVTQPSKQYAVIDGNSTIDFSGFPHYIEMPNMHAFSNSGFPFSRMADLSETVVVVAEKPSAAALQSFLNIMGVIGADTGYPGINVQLIDRWDKQLLQDKDILSIGVAPSLNTAEYDTDQVNLTLNAGKRLMKFPNKNEELLDLKPSSSKQDPTEMISVQAQGAFAAITGIESPFSAKRSLITIMAANPQDLSLVDEALSDSGKVEHMFGSVVTIRNNEVASYNVGEHYYSGKLPIWQLVWYHFSNHPILLAFIVVFLMLIVTIVLWRILRPIAAKRLQDNEDES
ncbi:cellulose biosynthesis cyclic di-GMP-binding regulatory protein BcsB [Shewanella violacea]